jgi:hypothetical protein
MIFLSLIFIYIVLKLFIFFGVPIFEIFMFCTAMDLDPILNCSLHVLKKNYILTDSNINTIDLKLQERKIIYANHLLQKKNNLKICSFIWVINCTACKMRPKLLKLVHCAPVEMNCSPVASHFVEKANYYIYHKYYKH